MYLVLTVDGLVGYEVILS